MTKKLYFVKPLKDNQEIVAEAFTPYTILSEQEDIYVILTENEKIGVDKKLENKIFIVLNVKEKELHTNTSEQQSGA